MNKNNDREYETHELNLINEFNDLTIKIANLQTYINGMALTGDNDISILTIQLQSMRTYGQILRFRLKSFGIEENYGV